MRKEAMRLEMPDEADLIPSTWNTKEERLAIDMILELSSRFGLRHPHDVASVLKVSHDEAGRLLDLAAAKLGSV